MSPKYEGIFNWHGQVIKLKTTKARNPSHAFTVFIKVLSKIVERTPYSVRHYFSGMKDNYSIIKK